MAAANQSAPRLEGGSSEHGDHAIFGVLTVSDRASQKVYDDISGPAILEFFQQAIKSKYAAPLHDASKLCIKQHTTEPTGGLQCTKSFQMSAT